MKRIFSLAQSTSEYAIVLAIVAAAIIGMQIYVKRGIQGRVRDLADQISPTHYEQGNTGALFSIEQTGTTTATYSGGSTHVGIGEEGEVTTKKGYEDVTIETSQIQK